MKRFRFVLALVMVAALTLGMPLTTFAATWDVTDSEGVVNAFQTDKDAEVIINMHNDISMNQVLTANAGQNYTINGNGNTISHVAIEGSGSVEIDADVTAEDNDRGLVVGDKASVTVTGDVEGVQAREEAEVTVEGNVTIAGNDISVVAWGDASVTVEGNVVSKDSVGISASENATVEVSGDVSGAGGYGSAAVRAQGEASVTVGGNVAGTDENTSGVIAYDEASVSVGGNVTGGSGILTGEELQDPGNYSDGGIGVAAYDKASVSVDGNVTGGNAMGTFGWGGSGAAVYDEATLEVGGNITGGNVVAEPNVKAYYSEEVGEYSSSAAGDGLVASYGATVTVGGDVTGGTTTGEHGTGGNGIWLEAYDDEPEQGSVTVAGTVSGGAGGENGEDGAGVYIYSDARDLELEDTDLERALNTNPAELTDDQMTLLMIGLYYAQENELVTEGQVDEIFANAASDEAATAAIQELLKAKLDTSMSLLEMMGTKTAKLTVGAVSGKGGISQYDSALGQEDTKKYAVNKVSYGIKLVQPKNGTITVDKTAAKVGETVTVTVKADAGYEIKLVSNGIEELKANADGSYTFTVALSGGYEVSAVIEAIPPAATPATGDGFDMMFFAVAAVVSMLGICAVAATKKRTV